MDPDWLAWGRRLRAIAQNGLAYSSSPFEIERCHAIQQLADEIMSRASGAPSERIAGLFDEEGYATPKVDVRGVVFDTAGRILLVKELADGGWTLPGGWADVGDSPAQAIEREVFEESGYQVRADKLLALYDRRHPRHGHPAHPHHIYKLFFRCQLLGGEPTSSSETGGAGWFAEDALPPLSMGRTTPSQLARLFEHSHHPDWPADFD
jgi:ADP-ribose pyrophosphatase YjhB (NUDIX family)